MNTSVCDECLCTMLQSNGNSSIVSFNCYKTSTYSVVCQLFTKANYSFSYVNHIETNLNSTFYFLQLPFNNRSATTAISETYMTTANITTVPVVLTEERIFWSFDSNFDDFYGVYNGLGWNNLSFISPGYTGYGSALSLQASQSQYVLVSKFLNMTNRSFTWELWTYPISLVSGDHVMLSMCQSTTTGRCLQLIIRNYCSYFAFYNDDCNSFTNVPINQWHHFAFVYDHDIRAQHLYMNGNLVCRRNSWGPFLGDSGAIIIGASNQSQTLPLFHWNGYIDQLSYAARAKSAIEILTDATLVAYYSFDNESFYDSGPNKINGTGINLSLVNGRINKGILLNTSNAYFQARGLTLLGASYRSYSISLWVYRFGLTSTNGTIVHLSSAANGGSSGWCLPIIGLSSSTQIVVQNWNGIPVSIVGPVLPVATWTHIVNSYSIANGIRLWVNGSFVDTSSPFNYVSSSVPNFITIGSSLLGTVACAVSPIQKGQFYGIIDEVRIYSRELNASDVYALANP